MGTATSTIRREQRQHERRRPASRQREQARLHAERHDTELLEHVRGGSDAAYAELFRRYEPDVRRYARSIAQTDEVDDVVGEAFASVLAALKRGRGPVDHPIKYLFAATRNTVITFHRQRERAATKAERAGADRSMSSDPDFQIGDEFLFEAFRTLTPRWRKALWWSEIDGLTATEIGERLGVNAAAAASLTYRARNALRTAYLDARVTSAAEG